MIITPPTPISLWPGFAPGETTAFPGRVIPEPESSIMRVTDVTAAQLYVYGAAPGERRGAILVCPGGGYEILAADLEGFEIAEWLVSLGFAAAVLYYRVPGNRDGALQDGQRALSYLRAHADAFGIDPGRVGVLGFSAGGHLAIRLAAQMGQRRYAPVDDLDLSACGAEFALGIYPAYLIDRATGAASEDVRPDPAMPPVFLAQTEDDSHFCTAVYAEALKGNGVPVNSRVYSRGGHGYGIRLTPDVPAAQWQDHAAQWLRSLEFSS